MPQGKIRIWFSNKGYGFIERNSQDSLFFHITQWKELDGSEPSQGASVSFEVGPGKKGVEAKNVRLLNASPQAMAAEIDMHTDNNEYRFLNPYNFVHYMDSKPKNRILGKCLPPPHDRYICDRYIGMTGRITCKIDAITPLFISDSHAVEENEGHKTYRFFQYECKPALPASSLRGMIRTVFEAVTNSCFSVFQKDEPYTLEHRKSRAPDMIPARVLKLDESGAVFELLDCTVNSPVDVSRYPTVVRAGAVRQSYPPQVLNRRTNKEFDLADSQLPKGICDGMRVAAIVTHIPVTHRSGRFSSFHATKIVPGNQHQSLNADEHHLKVFGWLHLTGPNIENKHDERIFFRWDDKKINSPDINQIPDVYLCKCESHVIAEFNHHLKEYWERLGKTVEKLGGRIWPNSTDGVPHPSTFVKKNNALKIGDLVYVQRNAQGIVTMLRTVSMPRIPYAFPREKFLPEYLKRCDKYDTLCPACRVFGWVSDNPQESEKRVAYAGRVRFSHGKLIHNNGSMPDTPLAILSTPKPTTTSFYLVDSKGEPNLSVDYDTPDAKLRGRKFYRHHGKVISDEYVSLDKNKSDQNRTIRGALKPGAQFEFTLDFENLAPLELGAIIYALELAEGMVHRLGYAKPLGFGSIRVICDSVEIMDWNDRLNSLEPNAGWSPAEKNELKNAFLTEMQENYKEEFDKILSDLRILLSSPSEIPIHYPRPTREPNRIRPQFEWFMVNKKLGKDGYALDLAKDDTRGLPYLEKARNR